LGGIALRAWLLDHIVLAPSVPEEEQGHMMMKYIYYPTYTRLDGLVVGVGLAIVRTFRSGWFSRMSRYGDLSLAFGLAAIAGALGLCDFGYPSPDLRTSVIFAFPVLSIGFGLMVAAAVSPKGILTRRVPGAQALAAISFSLYLTHKSVAHAIHQLLPTLTGKADWWAASVYFVVCPGFAALLYFAVEKPFLLLGLKRSKKGMCGLAEREVRLDPAI
jgi:peptidoglycan/LPS O-acetylase OafA/YrhL